MFELYSKTWSELLVKVGKVIERLRNTDRTRDKLWEQNGYFHNDLSLFKSRRQQGIDFLMVDRLGEQKTLRIFTAHGLQRG